MIYKLRFSTGKEIELTPSEVMELYAQQAPIYPTYPYPYYPYPTWTTLGASADIVSPHFEKQTTST